MVQENFFNQGDLPSNAEITQDELDLDSYLNSEPGQTVLSKDIKPATEEDIAAANEDPKQKKAKEKAAAKEAMEAKKAEKDLDAYMGDDDDDEQDEDPEEDEDENEDEEDKPENKKKPENKVEEVVLGDVEEFSRDLFATGILTQDDDDLDDQGNLKLPPTQEELVERLTWEKEKGANQIVVDFFSQHGPEWERALNAIAVNGVHPEEYLKDFAQVLEFKSMDLTDEINQETIVRASLQNQNWEEEDIRDEIKKLKTNSDLEETAKRAHKGLIKVEEQNLAKQEQEARQRTEAKKISSQKYTEGITNVYNQALKSTEIGGIPVSREIADKARAFIEKPAFKLPNGNIITKLDALFMELKNPHNTEAAFQLAALVQDLEPGKPVKLNLKPVEKRAKSKEAQSIFKSIPSRKTKTDPVPNKKEENTNVDYFRQGLR